MSSQYPILDNRPIDQWKVTELKEELKRRKLPTKGLKDDLIKRLDEALRIERESAMKDANNGIDLDPQHVIVEEQSEPVSTAGKKAEVDVVDGANKREKVDNVTAQNFQIDINDSLEAVDQGYKDQENNITVCGTNSYMVEEELAANTSTDETSVDATQNVDSELALDTSIGVKEDEIPDVALSGQIAHVSGTQKILGIDDSRPQQENKDAKIQLEGEELKPQMEKEVSKCLLDGEDMKPAHEDAMFDTSATANQVSEVSPNLGFQVKSDSISTDSVSINEKIELKDNIIADNVKLELDVKPEIVEPLSDNVVPVGGESHPMDVEEPQEKKPSVGDKDTINASNADISKKNDIVEIIDSEKLNLDRSSGDDSMEDDVLESKQIDSKYNPDEVGDKTQKNEVIDGKEENLVDVVGNDPSTERKEVHVENKIRSAVPTEKRKLNDKENVVNEPLKRQRRWNSETTKASETETANLMPTKMPKDAVNPAPMRRNFSRSDSSVSEDSPKERVVPPSQKLPTNSLRIDNFLRPFTLKAVQELLGKTGTFTSFWMDQIKTHCYVTYSSVDEAVETRKAVYNLRWPLYGGRLLEADFVDPQEVTMRVEAPPQSPATPITPSAPAAPPSLQPQPSPRQQVPRQQLPPPPALPPPPPLSNPPLARERFARPPPPPPPLPEKHEPPIITLDDLFQKTKATPRIYYLPLSEEQVAAKLAGRGGRNTKQ